MSLSKKNKGSIKRKEIKVNINYLRLDKTIKILSIILINTIFFTMVFSSEETDFSSVYFIVCIVILSVQMLIILTDTAFEYSKKIGVRFLQKNKNSIKYEIVAIILLSTFIILNTYNLLPFLTILITILFVTLMILLQKRLASYFKGLIANWIDLVKVILLLAFLVLVVIVVFDEQISIDKSYDYIFYSLFYSVVVSLILVFKNLNECLVNKQFKNLTLSVVLFFIIFLVHIFLMNAFLMGNAIDSFLLFGKTHNLSYYQIFYYSVINITNVGFGDITPNSIDSQTVSVIASVGGYLIFSSLIGLVLSITYNEKFGKN